MCVYGVYVCGGECVGYVGICVWGDMYVGGYVCVWGVCVWGMWAYVCGVICVYGVYVCGGECVGYVGICVWGDMCVEGYVCGG